MGIIEKAAGRLGQTARDVTPEPQGTVGIIETVADPLARESRSAEPEHKAPDAPTRLLAPQTSARAAKRVELNLANLQQRGMVTPETGRTPVAEEFRAIKRTLLDRVSEARQSSRRSNLIMVTSSLPSEGKTFCAINLAMSIAAELDHTVLLVDADVARPSILRTLGLNSEPGLMDILLDRHVHVPDVLLKTNVDTLSILPAGSTNRHATELLASQSMSKLLDELASRYADRIVIFDSPPLLLTTEARALATQMGQIVMVVEAEKTTQKAVRNALRHIEACPNVNLVYNKAKAFPGGDTYGYYSYYK